MSPTFRLAQGVPGSSSALAVARKFGLPSTVIERAERFLTREDVQFESVVKKLNDERAALELARAAAARREGEAEELRARTRSTSCESRVIASSVRSRRRPRRCSAPCVARARSCARSRRALRAKKLDVTTAKETERVLDRVAAKVAIGGELEPLAVHDAMGGAGRDGVVEEARPVADAGSLKKGTRVWVPRLRAEADVLDVLADGSARVQAGAMRLVLPASELRLATEKRDDQQPEPKKKAARSGGGGEPSSGPSSRDPSGLEVALQTSDNSVDLRGLRTDDAITLAITFLDRSLNENRRVCFLIHGHGTGALKEAIRRELKSSPYVRYFRAGASGEGGDGVTIAWLS